ncbi:MAG: hypothetical protein U1F43_29115 [Myxococcota bacterium]
MRVVRQSASSDQKFNDTRVSLVRAVQRPDLKELVEKWLAQPVAVATVAQDRTRSAALTFTTATAECALARTALLDVICRSREFYFNAGGRQRQDPLRNATFVDSVGRLRRLSGEALVERARQLAERMGATSYPRITKEQVKEEAEKIRAGAELLAAKVQALALATSAKEAADRAFASAASVCQLELASFKRVLRAEKMSEAAVHEIIPGYSPSRRRRQPPSPPPAPAPQPVAGGATSASPA